MTEQTSHNVWIFHTTSAGLRNSVDIRMAVDVDEDQLHEKAKCEYLRNMSHTLRGMSKSEIARLNESGHWDIKASTYHDRSRGLSPGAAMRKIEKDAQAGNLSAEQLTAFAKQMADMAKQMGSGNGDENAGANA